MADEPTGTAAQGAPEPNPQGGTQQSADGASASGQAPQDDFDKDRALNTIRAQREAEAKLKADLAAAKAELDKVKQAQMSEEERRAARLAELEKQTEALLTERRDRDIRDAVLREARGMGLVDDEAALKLLDLSKLEMGTDGVPTNAKQLLTALVEAKPYLKPQPSTSSPTNPARGDQTNGAGPSKTVSGADVLFNSTLAQTMGGGVFGQKQ